MKIQNVWMCLLALMVSCAAQLPTQEPTSPASPSIGFNNIKGVSPVVDEDADSEERQLKKQLPGNQFVSDKRLLHETALMHEFMEGFKAAKECNGITFYLKTEKIPDFTVQISVSNHDHPGAEQTWTWILYHDKDRKLGGLGNQTNGKLTARDVCLTIWDDVDPNHFKKPGGRIE